MSHYSKYTEAPSCIGPERSVEIGHYSICTEAVHPFEGNRWKLDTSLWWLCVCIHVLVESHKRQSGYVENLTRQLVGSNWKIWNISMWYRVIWCRVHLRVLSYEKPLIGWSCFCMVARYTLGRVKRRETEVVIGEREWGGGESKKASQQRERKGRERERERERTSQPAEKPGPLWRPPYTVPTVL